VRRKGRQGGGISDDWEAVGGGADDREADGGGADESEAVGSAKMWVQAGVDDTSVGAAERRSAPAREGGRAATEGVRLPTE
jgi:hypothetical protein